jgi:hypothetical protein
MSAAEKLTSIRNRIQQLRNFLESNAPFTTISNEGMTLTVDRRQVMSELRTLESEEKRLTGKSSWIRKIDMS